MNLTDRDEGLLLVPSEQLAAQLWFGDSGLAKVAVSRFPGFKQAIVQPRIDLCSGVTDAKVTIEGGSESAGAVLIIDGVEVGEMSFLGSHTVYLEPGLYELELRRGSKVVRQSQVHVDETQGSIRVSVQ